MQTVQMVMKDDDDDDEWYWTFSRRFLYILPGIRWSWLCLGISMAQSCGARSWGVELRGIKCHLRVSWSEPQPFPNLLDMILFLPENHGSGHWLCLKGNDILLEGKEKWLPCFMGGSVHTPPSQPTSIQTTNLLGSSRYFFGVCSSCVRKKPDGKPVTQVSNFWDTLEFFLSVFCIFLKVYRDGILG